jgi:hypothetical protein
MLCLGKHYLYAPNLACFNFPKIHLKEVRSLHILSKFLCCKWKKKLNTHKKIRKQGEKTLATLSLSLAFPPRVYLPSYVLASPPDVALPTSLVVWPTPTIPGSYGVPCHLISRLHTSTHCLARGKSRRGRVRGAPPPLSPCAAAARLLVPLTRCWRRLLPVRGRSAGPRCTARPNDTY